MILLFFYKRPSGLCSPAVFRGTPEQLKASHANTFAIMPCVEVIDVTEVSAQKKAIEDLKAKMAALPDDRFKQGMIVNINRAISDMAWTVQDGIKETEADKPLIVTAD